MSSVETLQECSQNMIWQSCLDKVSGRTISPGSTWWHDVGKNLQFPSIVLFSFLHNGVQSHFSPPPQNHCEAYDHTGESHLSTSRKMLQESRLSSQLVMPQEHICLHSLSKRAHLIISVTLKGRYYLQFRWENQA